MTSYSLPDITPPPPKVVPNGVWGIVALSIGALMIVSLWLE